MLNEHAEPCSFDQRPENVIVARAASTSELKHVRVLGQTYLTITMLLVAWLCCGCSHPIRALVGGAMSIDGDMGVHGDMGVNGDIGVSGDVGVDGKFDMAGELTTVMKTVNTASPIRAVVIDGTERHGEGLGRGNVPLGRIAVLDLDGLLVDRNLTGFNSMGENPVALFREKVRHIESDPTISAVVVRINTPGGGVTASDILAHDIARLKTSRGIPVIACLMTTGTGGGYYIASHADVIVAHPTSVVGGIGVILNTYNMEETLGQFNIVSIPIKAGDKIDVGSPERMMEKDERVLLQTMADEFHQRFIDQVKSARGNRLAETDNDKGDDETSDIFDGRVFTGSEAAKNGLVDRIGYLDDAINLAGDLAGLSPNSAVVLLRRDNDRALTEFDVTPNTPMTSLLSLKMPGLDRSSMPTFLYLWQPEPSIVTAGGG